MKINSISSTQFAGIRNIDIPLEDGLNVIYGKNESGKSTLVNLLSRILFQNTKLDRRSDKDFLELYFPCIKKNSLVRGDFADGKLVFTTETGTYTLSKDWGSNSLCQLTTPDGVIRDQNKINEILKEKLLYGEGVYTNLLCSSQRNTDASLQTILDASQKTDAKRELTDAVSQAFAEEDGISVDAIEQAINAKIGEIVGKHWDIEHGAPIRKAGAGRWENGIGKILDAYYKLEDKKAVLDKISRLESDADRASSDYNKLDNAASDAEAAYERFSSFSSRLTVQSERKKAIIRYEKDLSKIDEVLTNWPNIVEALEKVKALSLEQSSRKIIDKYEAATKIVNEIRDLEAEIANVSCPATLEISQVENAQRSIERLENKLCGMNIAATVNMLGNNDIIITSLRTGTPLELSDGMVSISEAVKITVPGVMEMELASADVNVETVNKQIAEYRETISTVFTKYTVNSLDGLRQLAERITGTNAKIDKANDRLDILLGSVTYDELEAKAKAITIAVRPEDEIERDIFAVCGSNNAEKYITAKETILNGYATEYGSINELKVKAFDLKSELQKAKEPIIATEDIPDEYLTIPDPEAYMESLKKDLQNKSTLLKDALMQKTAACNRLEDYKESCSGDPKADVEKAKRTYDEQKELLNHWLHIKEVFSEQKEGIRNNPMQDIADSFVRYLSIISAGRVSSEFPEANKLDMNIYSNDNLLDFRKLSEGTKETVSLAFRLAVLDHLFPEGGGIIVFDDPFTDMDAERAAQSCKLIKECAARHQVIFLTCREDYLGMLNGNNIRL